MIEIDTTAQRNWSVFCHLSALFFLMGIPLGNILGPLIIWLIKRNEMPILDAEGKKALNFQISMTIYTFIAGLLCFVFIGFLFFIPLIIANVVLVIVAAVKTSNNQPYSYPLTIHFIR